MNFENIILNSYNRIENRNNLSGYFLREFKKAENEFYLPKDFFDNCIARLNNYKARINIVYEQKEHKYKIDISKRKNNAVINYPTISDIPFSEINLEEYSTQENKEKYEILTKEFAAFSIDDVCVNFLINLRLPDIIKIEKGLIEAYSQITESLPKPKVVKPPKEVITTFEQAALDDEHLEEIYSILNAQRNLFLPGNTSVKHYFVLKERKASRLYAIMKRLVNDGYFKVDGKELVPLMITRFKITKGGYNTYKNIDAHIGSLK